MPNDSLKDAHTRITKVEEDWLQSEADAEERSKSFILRRLIQQAMKTGPHS